MEDTPAGRSRKILLTGATGYVGGRLGAALLEREYSLRCLARSERKLGARPWAADPRVEVYEQPSLTVESLWRAMAGCEAAYYLIHSMEVAGADYAKRDRELAGKFAEAAERAGLPRIIYLGGLGELGDGLSEHLASRREVESVLASRSVPVTVFRAAMIIGSGSASFEVLRYLVERLPVMVTPRWVSTECQPIAISNVLHYLVQCLETPETVGSTLDIGGPEILTYRELMEVMAEVRGIPHRFVIPVPLLTPRLSAAWIHLVTPVSYRIARPLAEGLRNRVVCRDNRALELMPQRLLTIREAIDAALHSSREGGAETAWMDAGVLPGDPDWAGGTVFRDRQEIRIAGSREEVFDAVCRLGGGHTYYAADWLWRLRGWMDRLLGGPGLTRGRRNPRELAYGDALDFWRVTGIERPRRLTLRAEMKLPGEALLEFEVVSGSGSGESGEDGFVLRQTARFKPRGFMGLLYWYAVLPFHGFVFRRMLKGIKREAEKTS